MKLYFVYQQDHDGIQDYDFYVCPNEYSAKAVFLIDHPETGGDFIGVEEIEVTEQAIKLLRSDDEPDE